MFCKKCGAQLNDGAKFCNVCGAQFENAAPVADPFGQPAAPVADPFGQPAAPAADPFGQQAAPFGQQIAPAADPYATPVAATQNFGPTMNPKNGKGKVALIASISAIVALCVVVIICLFACGGGGASSIDEALEVYFEALDDKDIDGIEDIVYPSIFSEGYDSEIFEEEEFMDNLIDEVNPGDGKPKFGSIKITDKEKMSSDSIDKVNTNLEEYDDYIEIESGVNVTGKITIKVDGESNTYKLKASLVKADGDWYIVSISVGSSPLKEED